MYKIKCVPVHIELETTSMLLVFRVFFLNKKKCNIVLASAIQQCKTAIPGIINEIDTMHP